MLGSIIDFFSTIGSLISSALSNLGLLFGTILPDMINSFGSITELGSQILQPFIAISLTIAIVMVIFRIF